MLRPLWQRALAAVLAVWFALVMVDPGVLHACPVHGGHEALAAGAGHDSHDQGTHSAAADEHHAAAASTDSPAQGHDHASCTCSNDCSAGRTPASLAAPRAAFTAVVIWRAEARLASADTRPVSAPPYFLPFANGPPSVVLA